MRVALLQNKPGNDKTDNLKEVLNLIPQTEFDLLVLPESFNSPYGINYFKFYAENIDLGGETLNFLKEVSLKYKNSYIIGGINSGRKRWKVL